MRSKLYLTVKQQTQTEILLAITGLHYNEVNEAFALMFLDLQETKDSNYLIELFECDMAKMYKSKPYPITYEQYSEINYKEEEKEFNLNRMQKNYLEFSKICIKEIIGLHHQDINNSIKMIENYFGLSRYIAISMLLEFYFKILDIDSKYNLFAMEMDFEINRMTIKLSKELELA